MLRRETQTFKRASEFAKMKLPGGEVAEYPFAMLSCGLRHE
jgi:hypothetical protein